MPSEIEESFCWEALETTWPNWFKAGSLETPPLSKAPPQTAGGLCEFSFLTGQGWETRQRVSFQRPHSLYR